jgi:hypothetical protein
LLWESCEIYKYTVGQNAEFMYVKADGAYTNDWAFERILASFKLAIV